MKKRKGSTGKPGYGRGRRTGFLDAAARGHLRGERARTRTADMPRSGGPRKRKASERAAAAAAAAQEAQEAAVAAAAARGRGKENTKAKKARQQAEKVLRAHGVEPVAAADDPTGYANVQQLAELNLKLQKAQNRGPEAAVRYRTTTPSPQRPKGRRRAVATVESDEEVAAASRQRLYGHVGESEGGARGQVAGGAGQRAAGEHSTEE